MIKRILLFSFLFVLVSSADAQKFIKRFYIKGTLHNVKSTKLYAFGESTGGKVLLDSVDITSGKQFKLMVKTRSYPGFIYLSSNIESFQEPLFFYIDGSSDTIQFESFGTKFIDSITFIKNPANLVLYQLLKLEKIYLNSTDKKSQNKYLKELNNLQSMSDDNLSTQFLYNYFSLKYKLKTATTDRSIVKTSLIKINQHIDLLNTDILDYVFDKFIKNFESKSKLQTEMEITLQDTFLNMLKSYVFKEQLVLKFGNIFISYLTHKSYYTALGNYISNASYIQAEYEQKVWPKLIAGEKIEPIKGLSLKGNKVDVNEFESDYKVVFIWSPDCDHCAKSMPEMNAIYEERKQSNIQFYGFSILKLDSTTDNILKWKNSNMIFLGWENEFLQKYGINYTPVILLLDKNNTIIEAPEDGIKLRIALLKLR